MDFETRKAILDDIGRWTKKWDFLALLRFVRLMTTLEHGCEHCGNVLDYDGHPRLCGGCLYRISFQLRDVFLDDAITGKCPLPDLEFVRASAGPGGLVDKAAAAELPDDDQAAGDGKAVDHA